MSDGWQSSEEGPAVAAKPHRNQNQTPYFPNQSNNDWGSDTLTNTRVFTRGRSSRGNIQINRLLI